MGTLQVYNNAACTILCMSNDTSIFIGPHHRADKVARVSVKDRKRQYFLTEEADLTLGEV